MSKQTGNKIEEVWITCANNERKKLDFEDISSLIVVALIDSVNFTWSSKQEGYQVALNQFHEKYLEYIITRALVEGYEFIVDDMDYELNEEYVLTLEKFRNGIQEAINDGYWDGEDISEVDDEIGDVMMQYALFGEVVYG